MMVGSAQNCGAMMALVCTDVGRHRMQAIEVLERDGGSGGRWSEYFGSAREAFDTTLDALLDMGAVPASKLVERNGSLESRHRGGVRATRHGTEVVCPRCHRRYPFRAARFYRGLDAAVELGKGRIDLSYLRRG